MAGPQSEPQRRAVESARLFEGILNSFFRNGPRLPEAPQKPEPVKEEPRKEPEKAPQWHALIKLTELTEAGGKGQVVRSFDDAEKAKTYGDRHKALVLYPWPLDREPPRGMVVEIETRELEALNRNGRGEDLARQFRVLRSKAEQGVYHGFGLWNERDEAPRLGQLVNFTTGIDYRGEPVGRLVSPLRAIEPGEPAVTRPVVFEMSREVPGVGRIVELPEAVEEAKETVKALDEQRLHQEKVLNQWATFDVGTGLRELVTDRVPQPPPLKVTTHDLGEGRRVDVVDRIGEHGRRERSYVVTREIAEADGSIATRSKVFESEDIRSIVQAGEAMKLERANAREARQQDAESKVGVKEPERPAPTTPLHKETQAEEPASYRDNTRWVVGIWRGEGPPKLEQPIWFEPGEARLEDRAMTPLQGDTRAPAAGERVRYVMAEVVDAHQGLAVVRGSTRDREYATHRVGEFMRGLGTGHSLQAEQGRRRSVQMEPGLSMGL